MVLENSVYTRFQPKFKNLDEDRERYLFAILDLHEAGKIEKPDGHSLYSAYAEQGYAWIDAQYWERGLHDLIEAYHCHSEIAFGPIYEGSLKVADRFVELGEAHRGRRIWRNHLASQLMHYWFYADEKRKGFRMAKGWLAPEEEQRQDHERIVAKLPEKKAELLKMLQAYRDWLIATDAPARDLERLDRDVADVEAERRSPPPGKPDPRAMDQDLFWEIVEAGLGSETTAERIEALPERLARFKAKPIRDFGQMMLEKDAAAYRDDVWALAYLMRGGCSDGSFDGFRAWLIMQGRATYEAVLADPDAFDVARFQGDSDGCQSVLESAEIAYEHRSGKAMRRLKLPAPPADGPKIDEEDFARHLPRIAKAVDWDADA